MRRTGAIHDDAEFGHFAAAEARVVKQAAASVMTACPLVVMKDRNIEQSIQPVFSNLENKAGAAMSSRLMPP